MDKTHSALHKSMKFFAALIFLIYAAYMLWLLFIRSRPAASGDYWEIIRQNLSLIPFRTLFQYINTLLSGGDFAEIRHAFINIFGNIFLFVPFGILLPVIFEKMRRTWRFLLCFAAAIASVEAIQLFSLRGACDIDDLILNTFGALCGFLIFRIAAGIYSSFINRKKS